MVPTSSSSNQPTVITSMPAKNLISQLDAQSPEMAGGIDDGGGDSASSLEDTTAPVGVAVAREVVPEVSAWPAAVPARVRAAEAEAAQRLLPAVTTAADRPELQ